jgi:hypothetical protein
VIISTAINVMRFNCENVRIMFLWFLYEQDDGA